MYTGWKWSGRRRKCGGRGKGGLGTKETNEIGERQDYTAQPLNPNTESQTNRKIESPLMDVKEVAAYLNLKPSKIRMMVFRKEVPYLKIGALVRFHRQAIDQWLLTLSPDTPFVLKRSQFFDSSILSNGSPQQRRTP